MSSNELESFIDGLDAGKPSVIASTIQPKGEPEKGQYFVDQNTGQYYYQSADGEPMAVVANEEPATSNFVFFNIPATSWLMLVISARKKNRN
jgi:hypothetical protein